MTSKLKLLKLIRPTFFYRNKERKNKRIEKNHNIINHDTYSLVLNNLSTLKIFFKLVNK